MRTEGQNESLGAHVGPRGLLEVQGLTARYGAVMAVRDVSLEVGAGEIVALLGANGAGKSTTLACIAGLHRSRHGQIRFEGQDISRLSPERVLRRGISLTPEGRRLFSALTVEENLLLGGATRGRRGRNDYGDLLALFPILRERLKLPAALLSGGERALAALAFLFAIFRARPSPFYLMDEVEAALDDVNLLRFLEIVRDFAGDSQVLVVTHQKRTMEMADILYGVSMGQGGASAVISQRLAEARSAT